MKFSNFTLIFNICYNIFYCNNNCTYKNVNLNKINIKDTVYYIQIMLWYQLLFLYFFFLQKYLNELACNQKINIPRWIIYNNNLFIVQTSYRDYLHIRDISDVNDIFPLFFLHLTNSNNFLLYILNVFAETTKLTINRSTEMKVPPTTENKIFKN